MLRTRFPAFTQHLLDKENDETHELIPGLWRSQETMRSVDAMRGNNSTKAAKAQRDYVRDYMNSNAGAVEWQDSMI
jgi:hypothetical protein